MFVKTFFLTYAIEVYNVMLLFLSLFSLQCAVVDDFNGVLQMRLMHVWESVVAFLVVFFSQRGPVHLYFTFEGWRALTVCIIATQPSMDQNVGVNFLKAHFVSCPNLQQMHTE